ncbi:TIR-NBS-LRR resistance protein [Quillaja saponaria]|uniref:TIR-NBS-LRR resistance protein n=1 Tax=Quillaja saponaria TaxID=32244 RepID=A0AAD7PDI3_QUISA|nr:TIR-NBS-LRR resistance protein [Quillaja saponaria]
MLWPMHNFGFRRYRLCHQKDFILLVLWFSICLPGSEIPKSPQWFITRRTGTLMTVTVPPNCYNDPKLVGFALCILALQQHWNTDDIVPRVFRCYKSVKQWHFLEFADDEDNHNLPKVIQSDHVFLWYDPDFCSLVLEDIKVRAKSVASNSTYCPEVSFVFSGLLHELGLVTMCGVYPLYAQDDINQL